MDSIPSVSVIIPVKNEASKIRACIDGILTQSVPVKEIIVIDSGSTDGTIEIIKSYDNIKLVEIPAHTFNHGSTRNLGVNIATGEFCLLTVGDARPVDSDWIKKMLEGFSDTTVAGVCGQQVVSHDLDKNPVEWFHYFTEPKIIKYQFDSAEQFFSLTPEEKKDVCSWDDVNAMYRRTLLLKIPFRHTPFAEDMQWAADVLQNGHSIVYNYAARVYHYHLENSNFSYKRTFTVLYFRYKTFGYLYSKPTFTFRKKLSIIKLLALEKKLTIKQKIKWYIYNVINNKAIDKAIKDFNTALKKGEDQLDLLHQNICGAPPIPDKIRA